MSWHVSGWRLQTHEELRAESNDGRLTQNCRKLNPCESSTQTGFRPGATPCSFSCRASRALTNRRGDLAPVEADNRCADIRHAPRADRGSWTATTFKHPPRCRKCCDVVPGADGAGHNSKCAAAGGGGLRRMILQSRIAPNNRGGGARTDRNVARGSERQRLVLLIGCSPRVACSLHPIVKRAFDGKRRSV